MKIGPAFDVNYDEGLKVGYKWYDAEKKPVLFPFGFGLSYTTLCVFGIVGDGGRFYDGHVHGEEHGQARGDGDGAGLCVVCRMRRVSLRSGWWDGRVSISVRGVEAGFCAGQPRAA